LIQAVFFDVGATLLTPAEDEGTTFTLIAERLGITIDPRDVGRQVPLMYELYEQLYEQDDSFWSDDVRAKAIWIEMYEFLASRLSIPHRLQRELAEAVYQYYFSPGAWVPYDDVLPLLDALQARGIRMALISNWDSTLAPIIEGLGMSPYFEAVIASAVVRLHKPMPEIFRLALDRLGIGAQETLHVGDHLSADVEGASAVGITPVLLDRKQQHADYDGLRVTSLAQIEALL
jgi:putative hydrolase of the HAD superfamily